MARFGSKAEYERWKQEGPVGVAQESGSGRSVLQWAKDSLKGAVLGELVRDWGIVHLEKMGYFTEEITLALYAKAGRQSLWLNVKYTGFLVYNSYGFQIPVYELDHFASTLLARYQELCRQADGRPLGTIRPSDRLPFSQRILIRVIHGIRASAFLLDHKDPSTGETDYRFYGYLTRKLRPKILIQSDLDVSQAEGHVISGEGFQAVLQALLEHCRGDEAAIPG